MRAAPGLKARSRAGYGAHACDGLATSASARVRLGHILTAVGLNVLRLGEWFLETARAKTRITPFARLMADAAAA